MTHLLNHEELLARRTELLAQFRVPEEDVYELARTYALRPDERALFRAIEACDFLLEASSPRSELQSSAA